MAWYSKQWGTLPEPGGLRDQRAGEIERMTVAYNVWDAAHSWFHCPPKERKNWRDRYPDRARIRNEVERLRSGRET